MDRPSGRAPVSLRAGVGRRLACNVTWVIAAMAVLGCSSSKSTGGSGGATGSGGRAGTGGATSTGGSSGGSGGSGGSGVSTGTGGAGTGGLAGSPGGGGRGGASGGATGGTNGDGGVDRADAGGSDVRPSDAAGDGAAAFAPCPTNGTACVILPLGDSITEGFNSSGGGYRVELFRQTVINAKSVTFVGSLANGPATVQGRAFPMNHEGHDGYTIDYAPSVGRNGISSDPTLMMMVTDHALATYHPNIVLLMIGTNDVDLSVDLPNAPTRLGNLLDRITTGAPNALLVVAQITPTTNDVTNARIQTYNAAIPQLVQTRVAAGKHIQLVNMYGAFTANAAYKTTLMSDELHPNDTGYALLGQTWYGVISAVLP
jgi:lysophospholipase L1-like esterase